MVYIIPYIYKGEKIDYEVPADNLHQAVNLFKQKYYNGKIKADEVFYDFITHEREQI